MAENKEGKNNNKGTSNNKDTNNNKDTKNRRRRPVRPVALGSLSGPGTGTMWDSRFDKDSEMIALRKEAAREDFDDQVKRREIERVRLERSNALLQSKEYAIDKSTDIAGQQFLHQSISANRARDPSYGRAMTYRQRMKLATSDAEREFYRKGHAETLESNTFRPISGYRSYAEVKAAGDYGEYKYKVKQLADDASKATLSDKVKWFKEHTREKLEPSAEVGAALQDAEAAGKKQAAADQAAADKEREKRQWWSNWGARLEQTFAGTGAPEQKGTPSVTNPPAADPDDQREKNQETQTLALGGYTMRKRGWLDRVLKERDNLIRGGVYA